MIYRGTIYNLYVRVDTNWFLFQKYQRPRKIKTPLPCIYSHFMQSLYLHLQCFNLFVPDLFSPRYEVQLQACTELGCASSEWASVQTLEAPPAAQPAPLIEIQTRSGGFQPASSVLWTGPQQPNGKILYYELYRRRASQAHVNLELVLVYNGTSAFFRDDQLMPYTEYEYQVG